MSNNSISTPPRATLGKSTGRKPPAPPAPARPSEADDHQRGRALAIELVAEGQVIADDVHEYGTFRLRAQRRGAAFENFALQYLDRVLAEPNLREGFASILTVVLSSNATYVTSALAAASTAEFLAGEVGADGTQTYEQAGMDDPVAEAEAASADAIGEQALDSLRLHTWEALDIVEPLITLVVEIEDADAGACNDMAYMALEVIKEMRASVEDPAQSIYNVGTSRLRNLVMAAGHVPASMAATSPLISAAMRITDALDSLYDVFNSKAPLPEGPLQKLRDSMACNIIGVNAA